MRNKKHFQYIKEKIILFGLDANKSSH